MRETWVWSPWRRKRQPTPVLLPGKSYGWMEEPGRLQSIESQRVRHDWLHFHFSLFMQTTSCEMPGWMKYKLESRFLLAGINARRNSSNLRYADETTLMAESKEKLKSFLMRVKQESEKALELNIQKTKIRASGPITS